MLKDLLKTSLGDPGRTRHATREWKNLLAIVSSGTEFMWKQTLPGLRASIPKKTVPTTCSVRTTGQVSLPDYVEKALKLGPKFAVEPRLSAPELLSLVRRISKCAPEGEANRCISEGVDVISRKNIGASRVPVSRVVSFLKQKRLCVLPADKEGGFVVLGEAARARQLAQWHLATRHATRTTQSERSREPLNRFRFRLAYAFREGDRSRRDT
ncbi:hypothetical protein HPB51_015319 [Rhipicephalus microplus]|uniref:Tick transposon n=1 Tax=Rhipicephalus microplus TaxID=6941 RepID=A0A9J6DHG3_RHIMP|nr:hypothetical protein HPB51_015319 [Rhipicephalus microplus]